MNCYATQLSLNVLNNLLLNHVKGLHYVEIRRFPAHPNVHRSQHLRLWFFRQHSA